MDYLKSLDKAITYIEENLGDINVKEVAQVTGYSYYHLTRLFTTVIGESVGSYIKKRRLADAAQKLLYSDKRIIDIAIENGFESSEAFSRAFKSTYKISPSTYRKNRLDVIVGAKRPLKNEILRHLTGNITLKPEIVETKEIKVAGIRGNTTLNDNVIPKLWEQFWQIRKSIPNILPTSRAFGICESGQTIFTMDGETSFSEVVGIEVISFDNIVDPIVTKILPSGKYAVFTHTGSLKNLRNSYEYIWGTWIPGCKEKLDNREDFEVYDLRYLGYDHPNTQFDIYIPLK
ncbi:MAG: AraC family transcriptional regulator [Anaerolineales bacterium]|nr:AraC family transcriptional regulator [Anaerolineales bacterium]